MTQWSAAYQRNSSQPGNSTFVMSWFLSSCCFADISSSDGSRVRGCIHRTPGSPFNLHAIMGDITAKVAEEEYNTGAFMGLERLDLPDKPTVDSSRDALASYGIFLAISLGVWLWQVIIRKNSIRTNSSSWRVMAGLQAVAAIALLVASAVTTAAAYKANSILGGLEGVFRYHSIGVSFSAMTWCAFISHLLGLAAYAGSVYMWERLQQPELYPPELEPEHSPESATRLAVPPGAGARARRRAELPVHREHDPNDVDDELPPYSRVDPNAGDLDRRAEPNGPAALQESFEMNDMSMDRNQGALHNEDLSVPAPDYYELHERPLNHGTGSGPEGSRS